MERDRIFDEDLDELIVDDADDDLMDIPYFDDDDAERAVEVPDEEIKFPARTGTLQEEFGVTEGREACQQGGN